MYFLQFYYYILYFIMYIFIRKSILLTINTYKYYKVNCAEFLVII